MRRAITLSALVLSLSGLAGGCRRADPFAAPESPRAGLSQLSRCAFDGLSDDPSVDQVEAALRRELRARREAFSVRAGRCGGVFATFSRLPRCLEPLRETWDALLPVAQSTTTDAIALDLAVRHVGEAWGEARRTCPGR